MCSWLFNISTNFRWSDHRCYYYYVAVSEDTRIPFSLTVITPNSSYTIN